MPLPQQMAIEAAYHAIRFNVMIIMMATLPMMGMQMILFRFRQMVMGLFIWIMQTSRPRTSSILMLNMKPLMGVSLPTE